MGVLHRILGPSNSLVLLFDHLGPAEADEMEHQLEEVAKYYRFATLSEIASADRSRRQMGLAGVAFANARKSVFMRGIPALHERKIPFTLFLRPDCIGLNRVPIEDEFAAYARAFERPLGLDLETVSARVWDNPSVEEEIRDRLRREVGPLPVNEFDPTQFFVTWGKILEVPSSSIELGVALGAKHVDLDEALSFIRRQTQRIPTVAFSPRSVADEGALRAAGIRALLTHRRGYVEKSTPLFDIPHVQLEKSAPSVE